MDSNSINKWSLQKCYNCSFDHEPRALCMLHSPLTEDQAHRVWQTARCRISQREMAHITQCPTAVWVRHSAVHMSQSFCQIRKSKSGTVGGDKMTAAHTQWCCCSTGNSMQNSCSDFTLCKPVSPPDPCCATAHCDISVDSETKNNILALVAVAEVFQQYKPLL